MLPLIPKSVKMEPEVSSRLKIEANALGYSENQLIVESLKSTFAMSDDENNIVPRVVILLRSAKSHQTIPPRVNYPAKNATSRKLTSSWWAA